MGLSIFNQIDTRKYFSLSTINPDEMKRHNITISPAQLKEQARTRIPAGVVPTGSIKDPSKQRLTKFWRYDDFSEVKNA